LIRSRLILFALGAALIGAPPPAAASGDTAKGKELFEEQCSVCHETASTEKKLGPGLKGLFKRDKMANGKKPTVENVTKVIQEGGNGMPAYAEILSKEELEHVLAYLKTL
jgi:mono/diheme cytochrome c family protein